MSWAEESIPVGFREPFGTKGVEVAVEGGFCGVLHAFLSDQALRGGKGLTERRGEACSEEAEDTGIEGGSTRLLVGVWVDEWAGLESRVSDVEPDGTSTASCAIREPCGLKLFLKLG